MATAPKGPSGSDGNSDPKVVESFASFALGGAKMAWSLGSGFSFALYKNEGFNPPNPPPKKKAPIHSHQVGVA